MRKKTPRTAGYARVTPENLDELAPYIVGFSRVTMGGIDGFRSEDNGAVQFSWFEDGGKLRSLPWTDAVRRFGEPSAP